MNKIRIFSFRLHMVLLALFLLAMAPPVVAHGGGEPQLVNEAAGPYLVSVWSSPEPPAPGEFHITVAVAEPGQGDEAGPPVLGATVDVQLTPQGATEPLSTAPASNEASANKLFYEADVQLPEAGVYQVQVDVDGPDGRGQATFEIEAASSGGVNWGLMGGLGAALFVVVFAVNAWRSNRRPQ